MLYNTHMYLFIDKTSHWWRTLSGYIYEDWSRITWTFYIFSTHV